MLKTFYLAVLVWEIRCFQWGTSDFLEKKYFSSVTHTTHKETSAVCGGGGAPVPLQHLAKAGTMIAKVLAKMKI